MVYARIISTPKEDKGHLQTDGHKKKKNLQMIISLYDKRGTNLVVAHQLASGSCTKY
jgi:hypothetical protein